MGDRAQVFKETEDSSEKKGKVIDLLIPIICTGRITLPTVRQLK